MGGTDDPENLIELTIEEHAEAHRKLFEEHGCWQDYIAWQGLSKLIPKEELVRKMQSEAAKERIQKLGNPFSGVRTEHNFAINESFRKEVSKLANSPEAIAKKKETFKKIKHQQGEKNNQYGKRWIHSLVEKRSTRINKNDPLPEGWLEGRKMKFVDA